MTATATATATNKSSLALGRTLAGNHVEFWGKSVKGLFNDPYRYLNINAMEKNYHFSRKYFNFFPKRKTLPRYFHFLRNFSTFFLLMIRSTGEVYPPISTDGEIHPLFQIWRNISTFFHSKKRFHIGSKRVF